MSKFSIGKYKNILVSIGLFLILDASVLVLNFYISFQIAEDATSINLAGRQRMLSQRMTKTLLDLDYSYEDQQQRSLVMKELRASRNLFDETFTAFDEGGDATGAGGSKVRLNKADDDSSREAIRSAKKVWSDYKEKIDLVLDETPDDAHNLLQSAIVFGQGNNILLLKKMNDLTVALEQVAASKAQRLRLIQTAGIAMALINFFIILFHFVGQLRKGDEVLEEARKETSEILVTVNEGLFLIHEDFSIGSQRSKKLYDILSIANDDDINFEHLLKDIISDKDLEASEGFLRLLFNKKIKEKLIGDLNPLEKIQVNITDEVGGYNTKYLRFEFKRVYSGTDIVDVLATVNDITEKVLLEKELEEAKASNEKQIEMLTSILHANPSLLKSFLDNAYRSFSSINSLLKQPAKRQMQFQEKVGAIFVHVHNFKGEASALELHEFASMAHNFEEDLAVMRGANELKGQDFLSLTVRLDKIISYAQSVTALVDKLSRFGGFAETQKSSSVREDWNHLSALTTDLAEKHQKQVILMSSGFNDIDMSAHLKESVNSICIQFIRNAIVHGIELPEERLASQKNPQGRIDIRFSSSSDGMLEMVFRDDGAGFNFNKLRAKAISLGEWSEEEVEHWDNKRLLSLIFNPGFSTANAITEDAGRGVGMDVVMQKIKQAKGKITVSHKESEYTQFIVSFPIVAMGQVA